MLTLRYTILPTLRAHAVWDNRTQRWATGPMSFDDADAWIEGNAA